MDCEAKIPSELLTFTKRVSQMSGNFCLKSSFLNCFLGATQSSRLSTI